MRLFILLCLFVSMVVPTAFAQLPGFGFHRSLDSIEVKLGALSDTIHSGVQPAAQFFRAPTTPTANADQQSSINLCVVPLLHVSGGAANNGPLFRGDNGAMLKFTNYRCWRAHVGYVYSIAQQPNYLQQYSDSLNVLTGAGYGLQSGDLWTAHVPFGQVAYKAGKYIELEAGRGKHFWGDGYRSLILSDMAAPFPYFRATANIRKVQYTTMWAQMRDISSGQQLRSARIKYASMHHLSWNIHPKFNLSLFEVVVWQDRDTLSRRHLDLAYANPVLFFRPVEYAQGSADNVMLGGGFKWKWNRRFHLYGQLLLDEFLLREVRAARGWWGNKFGGQLGFRWADVGLKGLHLQGEFNAVRPFTYSHGSPVQAWGQFNQPLAHPLGANFWEVVGRISYQTKQWWVQGKCIVAAYGRDALLAGGQSSANFGGDIFRSYVQPVSVFGNTVSQGRTTRLLLPDVEVARSLGESGIQLFAQALVRLASTEGIRTTDAFVQVGFRSTFLMRPVQDF